ncbi:MAG: response regulator transcription factor [Elusimicrobia bacterium]|nr:response regulator transcription factor [Elusimicrobiota bacterium]
MARVLSIEDSPDLQQLIGLALQQRGYEVHYAFNGKEGYEKVLALDPDVVLLDLMIPVINGVEVIKKMKAARETRDIPVIVISAYGDDADMLSHSLVALGAVEYIRKPFDLSALVRRIETLLASSPRRQEAPPQEIQKGAVRLNVKFRTVWIDDQMVATVPPKLASLLRTLLESGSGVGRDRLMSAVWPSGGASPNALEKAIERLRKALGPHGHRLQTIERGYEFVI